MVSETLEKIARAHDVVSELCEGKRRWLMSIPARPDRDPDLIISNALVAARDDIADLTHELQAARERERRLCRALGDLIGLAEAAMREADDCGGEYDVDGELSDARAVLAEVEPLHPDL